MEDINAKLDLLELNERERNIALEKFLVTLSIVSLDEIKRIVEFLKLKDVHITKARELKVLCNDYNEIIKNFNIIDSINELDMYREDPIRINNNALDIFKKIKYCTQMGISYYEEV